jgi:hypothetical protein
VPGDQTLARPDTFLHPRLSSFKVKCGAALSTVSQHPSSKKGIGSHPSSAAAQNVIMKKLGISTEPHLETADFERYINLFQ